MEKWIVEYFEHDRLAKTLGFKIVEATRGYAKTEVEIEDQHLNGADMLHGGTIFALADFALAIACNYQGILTVSTNASISFMKAAKGKKVTAVANCINETRKLGFYVIKIFDENELISQMESTVYITGKENPVMKKYNDDN